MKAFQKFFEKTVMECFGHFGDIVTLYFKTLNVSTTVAMLPSTTIRNLKIKKMW